MGKGIFKTLFARMLTTYLTVILLLLLLMGITVSSMFHSQYIKEKEDQLKQETAQINAILAERYVDDLKRQGADADIKTVARKYDALIQVIDVWGNVLSSSHVDSADKWDAISESTKAYVDETPLCVSMPGLDIFPYEHMLTRVDGTHSSDHSTQNVRLQPITEKGAFFTDLFLNVRDMSTLTYVRAFVNSSGVMNGVILMHLDMRAVNASVRQVYLDVLLIGILAVLVAVLVVYYLTIRITKPITEMNSTVRQYSQGAFELRLNGEGADEVAQLANSFNVMATELSTLEQLRRSLVANVSHELRSPLSSIKGFLEAIQDGTIPPDKQGEYITLVIAETTRMTNMINNLLDLARMESGQNPLKLGVFDINELARRTLITFEARINGKRLDVELALMKPNCFVEADQDQVAQVLRNLIDNAIKFTPEGGRLIVRTQLGAKRTAQISVQDFGSGIPEEDIMHVFQRFYKAEKAHTPSAQSGTGLGLSIVRAIINQHGEDIWVKSKPGEGATFTFTLKHVPDPRRRNEQKPDAKSTELEE